MKGVNLVQVFVRFASVVDEVSQRIIVFSFEHFAFLGYTVT
jgi:hypothetical protein